MSGRTPDYYLKALNKRTELRSGKIGAAWLNEDGTITIRIDHYVLIPNDPEIILTLYPTDKS